MQRRSLDEESSTENPSEKLLHNFAEKPPSRGKTGYMWKIVGYLAFSLTFIVVFGVNFRLRSQLEDCKSSKDPISYCEFSEWPEIKPASTYLDTSWHQIPSPDGTRDPDNDFTLPISKSDHREGSMGLLHR